MALAEAHYGLPKIFGSLAAMENASNLERFGQIVRKRREGLGLQQTDLKDRRGPSSTTMSQIERALREDVTPLILRRLDTGLAWVPGSAARTLEGGDPTPIETARSDIARQQAAVEARLEQVAGASGAEFDTERVRLAAEAANLAAGRAAIEWQLRDGERHYTEQPLIDLVWRGQALAADKQDHDVTAFVRRVESAVVGVYGIERVNETLQLRKEGEINDLEIETESDAPPEASEIEEDVDDVDLDRPKTRTPIPPIAATRRDVARKNAGEHGSEDADEAHEFGTS